MYLFSFCHYHCFIFGFHSTIYQLIPIYGLAHNVSLLLCKLSANETERRMVLLRFGLDSLGRREALDKITHLAKAHFSVPLVVISIVLEDKEIFVSSAGWSTDEDDANYKQPIIPLVSGVCPHSMLSVNINNPAFVMEDASKDWRFSGNVSFSPSVLSRFRLLSHSCMT